VCSTAVLSTTDAGLALQRSVHGRQYCALAEIPFFADLFCLLNSFGKRIHRKKIVVINTVINNWKITQRNDITQIYTATVANLYTPVA